MTLTSLLLPVFFAALIAAAPASAQEPAFRDRAPESRMIKIDRASLSTEVGAASAYASIRAAAISACRAENRGGAAFERGVRICTKDTVARTVAALGAPRLTALHRRGGERLLASVQ